MLEGRKTLGASDVAAIVGMDRFSDAADVYDKLIARLDSKMPVDDPSPDQLRGIVLEEIAADLYSMRSGIKMRRIGQKSHRNMSFLHANCDRLALSDDTWETHPVEVKCPRPQTFQRVVEHGVDPSYIIQGQIQLACFPQYRFVRFVLLHSVTMETHAVVLERRDKLITSLENAVRRFWEDHIEPRIRPVSFTVELPQLPELGGEVEVWDDEQTVEFAEAWAKLHLIAEVAKQAETMRKLASATLCRRMGVTKKILVPELGTFSHVVVANSETVDNKAVKAWFGERDIDMGAEGLMKPKSGYEYIRPTFQVKALDALRPGAVDLILNGVENTPIKQIEEGNDDE